MRKGTGSRRPRQLELIPSQEEVLASLRAELHTWLRTGVMDLIQQFFEEEKQELCGTPWSRKRPA